MNEAVRGAVLLASVLLWLPLLRPVIEGRMTLESGLLRYALALGLAWAGGAGLTALVRSYAAPVEPEAPARRAEDTVEVKAVQEPPAAA